MRRANFVPARRVILKGLAAGAVICLGWLITTHLLSLPDHMTAFSWLPAIAAVFLCSVLFFAGKDPGFTPALAPEGTAFRKHVWELLLEIPYGETVTYGQIAERIAEERGLTRMSAQAVGGAVGSNPIPLIIPCHRVIGADGSLVGYGCGLWRKERLLALEQGMTGEEGDKTDD